MNPMSISPSQLQAQATYQELVSAFHTINFFYCITWECANLLIELGEGRNNSQDSDILSGPPTSTSPHYLSNGDYGTSRHRHETQYRAGNHPGR